MKRSRMMVVSVLAASLMLGAARVGQPEETGPERVRFGVGEEGIAARLVVLAPDDPDAYFLLGEEVHELAETREMVALARRLYVLALHHAPEENRRLRASACLALAELATTDVDRRWLRALGASLGRAERLTETTDPTGGQGGAVDQLAFDVAEAIGLVRAGNGRRAERLFDQPGAWELLEEYEVAGARAARIRRDMNVWPSCPQCGNDRRIRHRSGGQVRTELCFTCVGDPGPQLESDELLAQLRLEARLLNADHATWGAQVIADGGAPLRELEVREVARAFAIDPTLSVFRDGTWERPVSGEGAAPVRDGVAPDPVGDPATLPDQPDEGSDEDDGSTG